MVKRGFVGLGECHKRYKEDFPLLWFASTSNISRLLADEIVKDGYGMPWHHMDDHARNQLVKTDNQIQFATCFYNDGFGNAEAGMYPCSEKLLESARDIAGQHHSVFISAEALSTLTKPRNSGAVSRLSEFLTPLWEDITIILSYRYYHDWHLSYHNQMKNNWSS